MSGHAFDLTTASSTAASWLLDILLRTSIQGGLVIVLVWVVCRLAPRIPPGLRAGLWWLACLKLLVGFVWIEPLTLPVLPASDAVIGAARPSLSTSRRLDDADVDPTSPASPSAPATPAGARGGAAALYLDPIAGAASWMTRWPAVVISIVGLWLAVAIARVTRLFHHRRQCRALIARSTPPPDDVAAMFVQLYAQVGPPQRPRVRLSSEVQAPQVIGARRPVILLPSDIRERMSDRDLSIVLGHELMHVARGDLWLGWAPALAHDLFFFHPLAALAVREYRLAREAACDAAVVQRFDAEPQAYGRVLVTVGIGTRAATLAATCRSSSARHLKRRLHMLQHLPERPGRVWWWCVPIALLVGALIPIQLVAQREPATTRVDTAEDDTDLNKRWVFLRSNDASSMNGDHDDYRRAKTFQKHPDDRLIWFRRNGNEYVIRDPAILAAAEEAYRPLDVLGQEQAKLGEQQAKLGDAQAAFGDKQGRLGDQIGRLAEQQVEVHERRQKAVAAQMRAAADALEHPGAAETAARQAETERRVDELTRALERVSEQQAEIGRTQEALGREQEALGRQQSELGAIQERLGRKQAEASERAHGFVIETMKKALASGAAQKVR